MPKFAYKAHDPRTGRTVSLTVEADNTAEANRLIHDRGVVPISAKKIEDGLGIFSKKIRRRQLAVFTTQLATLIGAGLPLLQSLRNIANQSKDNEMKKLVLEFINAVESGINFSDALAKHPGVFNDIYINLVKAGEISGTLDISLNRLATQQEKDNELFSKLRSASIYPAIVIFVMTAVGIYMLVVVLPRIEDFYENFLEEDIFWLTAFLLAISRSLINYWFIYLSVIGGSVVGLFAFSRTAAGRTFFDQFKLSVPIFKKLFTSIYMARFARTMSTLFAAGINLVEALAITRRGINNKHINDAIDRSSKLVQEGGSLSAGLAKEPVFDTLMTDMIKIGEDSGTTDENVG